MSRLVMAALAAGAVAVPAEAERVIVAEKPITKLAQFKVGTLAVSPDGRRFAYARKEGKSFVVEVDGKAEGTYKDVGLLYPAALVKTGFVELAGIKPMIFSGDGRHLAFSALLEKKKMAVVHDGREGKPHEFLASGPVLTHDGQRLAYAAKADPEGWRVVVDGVDGKPYEKVGPPVFSPDGKRVAYAARLAGKEVMVVDGTESRPYDSLDVTHLGMGLAFPNMLAAFPTFGADGRLAYYAKRAEKWYMVVDGEESEAFEDVLDPVFSPDGKRLAFPVKKGGRWAIILDGQVQPGAYKKVFRLVFSPDGARLGFAAETDGGSVVVVDGKTVATHDDVSLPTFSPDGRRIAYAAKTGKQWTAVVDGVAQKPYAAVIDPVFSPDGSHVAYEAALTEGRWTVVVDGVEGKTHQGLVKGAKVTFDGNDRFHYLVVYQNQIVLMEEELRAP